MLKIIEKNILPNERRIMLAKMKECTYGEKRGNVDMFHINRVRCHDMGCISWFGPGTAASVDGKLMQINTNIL